MDYSKSNDKNKSPRHAAGLLEQPGEHLGEKTPMTFSRTDIGLPLTPWARFEPSTSFIVQGLVELGRARTAGRKWTTGEDGRRS